MHVSTSAGENTLKVSCFFPLVLTLHVGRSFERTKGTTRDRHGERPEVGEPGIDVWHAQLSYPLRCNPVFVYHDEFVRSRQPAPVRWLHGEGPDGPGI